MTDIPVKHKQSIKSFVCREGRMTPRQRQALESLWSIYGLDLPEGYLKLNSIFGRSAEKVIEIGFGMGGSLLQMAADQPDKDFLGIEVHRPGIGALLAGIEERNINNIKLLHGDANAIFRKHISDHSIDRIQVFFPDPWPKRRHHKRRLVQTEFIDLLVSKLKSGGYLHLATDWQSYAESMMRVLSLANGLENTASGTEFISNASKLRPITKFERRGRGLGHLVWDLLFRKVE